MPLGQIVEQGDAEAVHTSPQRPCTQELLAAVPQPDPAAGRARREQRRAASGTAAGSLAPRDP